MLTDLKYKQLSGKPSTKVSKLKNIMSSHNSWTIEQSHNSND